jgi:hypothetical protein
MKKHLPLIAGILFFALIMFVTYSSMAGKIYGR